MILKKRAVFPQRGSLVFFGDIFGGRYGENRHQIVEYNYDETRSQYTLRLNEDEKCTVYDPKEIEYGVKAFIINDASRIIWEWYYYGREKTVDNLNILDYKKINTLLVSLERIGNLAADPKVTTFEIKNNPALKFY
jgi:hypothetical protein